MSCLLTGHEGLANRESAQGLLSAYLHRHYSIPAHRRPQRNLRETFPQVATRRESDASPVKWLAEHRLFSLGGALAPCSNRRELTGGA